MNNRGFGKALVLCLIIPGTLDISDAVIFYGVRGVSPGRLLRGIASAVFGASALKGGLGTASVGLAIHYVITVCWAGLFLLASLKWGWLKRKPLLIGALYGVLIYCVMNYLLLPLMKVGSHNSRPSLSILINGVLALVLLMGVPIAFIARRFLHPAA